MPPSDPPTLAEFLALPLPTRQALTLAWLDRCEQTTAVAEVAYLSGDLERIGSRQATDWGE